jgi:hypothetical protein
MNYIDINQRKYKNANYHNINIGLFSLEIGIVSHNYKINNIKKYYYGILSEQAKDVNSYLRLLKIEKLNKLTLSKSINVLIEPDLNGYIAKTVDMPLYAFGDDIIEALDILKSEIESLYYDLMEDDNITKEWIGVKSFLKERIVTKNEK